MSRDINLIKHIHNRFSNIDPNQPTQDLVLAVKIIAQGHLDDVLRISLDCDGLWEIKTYHFSRDGYTDTELLNACIQILRAETENI